MIDLSSIAPFQLPAKSPEELAAIREAAMAAIMKSDFDLAAAKHAGLLLHYASRLQA